MSDMMTSDQGDDIGEANSLDHGGEEDFEQLNPEELIQELPPPRKVNRIRVKKAWRLYTHKSIFRWQCYLRLRTLLLLEIL